MSRQLLLALLLVSCAACDGSPSPTSHEPRPKNGDKVRTRWSDTIVWRSDAARSEGVAVAKNNPTLALGYTSCIVGAGEDAVVVDTSVFSGTVTIVVTDRYSGHAGCRGVVDAVSVQVGPQ